MADTTGPPADPCELAFYRELLPLVDLFIERGGHGKSPGTLEGIGTVLKRAAVRAGLAEAASWRTLEPSSAQVAAELRHDVDLALVAVEAAQARCAAVWQRWGHPEAHRALGALAAAQEALTPPEELPAALLPLGRRELPR